MPTYPRSPDVDALIKGTPGWRGATLQKLRDIVHAADPQITEAAKWKKPSSPLGSAVFERDGIVCIGIVLKERVRLSFADGSRLPDPKELFNAQLNGISRAIDFAEDDKPNAAAIAALVRAAVARRAKAKAAKAAKK